MSKQGVNSGVTGADVAQAPDIGKLEPGKRNLVQSTYLGNQWGDRGARCDGHDAQTPGCFLTDEVRLRYLIDFKGDVSTAATNYKLALQQIRFEELLKKDDDLNWVLTLALEIAGAHLLNVAVKALGGLKANGVQKFAASAFKSGSFEIWRSNAARTLNSISPKQLETYTKIPLNAAKTRTAKGMQAGGNEDQTRQKTAVVSYIDELTDQCDTAFRAFQTNASASAPDAELAVLFEGMQPENHSVGIYKQVLDLKLGRFRSSGVLEIGRKDARDRVSGEVGVHRDTRVVWIRDITGNRRLHYQSQEGNADHAVVRPGDPGDPRSYPDQAFGPHDPRESPVLGNPVPDEFRDVALARSEQQWGFTNEMEDPYIQWMRARGADAYEGQPTKTPAKPVAAASAAAAAPNPTATGAASTVVAQTAPQAVPPKPLPRLQLGTAQVNSSKAGDDLASDPDAAGL